MDELGRELQQAKKDLGEEQKSKRELQALVEVVITMHTVHDVFRCLVLCNRVLCFPACASLCASVFLGLSTSQRPAVRSTVVQPGRSVEVEEGG